jgi:hypothetical protein
LWRTDSLLGNDSTNTFPQKPTHATVGHRLLGNGSENKFSQQQRGCVLRGPCWGVTMGQRRSFGSVVRSSESSVGKLFVWVRCYQELGRVLVMAVEGDWEEIATKGSGGEKTTSCVVCSDSESYKSVAWIRLVKTENHSERVTVNCKVCKSAIALPALAVVPSCVYKVQYIQSSNRNPVL